MKKESPGFFIAPFVIDGEMGELGYWQLESLSSKWLAICGEFLEHYGDRFDEAWSGNLSHIETQFTAGSGAALMAFRVGGKQACSIALASGQSPAAEFEVIKMFVEFLRRVNLVRAAAAASPRPFEEMLTIKERPLMLVVPWPDSEISEQDHDLVRELGLHTAGAFFAREGVT